MVHYIILMQHNHNQALSFEQSCFEPVNAVYLQAKSPLIVSKFYTQHKEVRYLFLYSNCLVSNKDSWLDLLRINRAKMLIFSFDIVYSCERRIQEQRTAIRFINIAENTTELYYADTPQILLQWSNILPAYMNQTGLDYKYRLIKSLGKGISAEVFLAERLTDLRKFAVKIFKKDASKAEFTFQNQITILRVLNHNNIIKLYEVFVAKHQLSVVLEYLQGGSLCDELQTHKYNRQQQYCILSQIVAALEQLKLKRIVHRDIKPDNILIRNNRGIKSYVLCDFGFASWIDQTAYMFDKCGTAGYVAPEVLSKKGQRIALNTKMDAFSLGVVAHIVFTGRPAFVLKTDMIQLLKDNKKCQINLAASKYSFLFAQQRELLSRLLVADPIYRIDTDQIATMKYFTMYANLKDTTHNHIQNRVLRSAEKQGKAEIKYQNIPSFKRKASLNINVNFHCQKPSLNTNKTITARFLEMLFGKAQRPLKIRKYSQKDDMIDISKM